jgi:hypothetical protein
VRRAIAVFAIGVWLSAAGAWHARAASIPPIVQQFLTRQDPPLVTFVAARHLEASTRNGSMRGWIDACTELQGDVFTYRIASAGGSHQIQKRVLIAALDAEVAMHRDGTTRRSALEPVNYEFADDQQGPDGLIRVGMRPLRKDVTLVNGSMFVDPAGDLVRVEGVLAKRPSFWTRRVEVVRRYERISGTRVPVSMESTADVLIVGRSLFAMTYVYRKINGVELPAATTGDAGACNP